mmetsp:Transcript_11578/g.16522  ORF Transcript_11578/g.16522 Transcript_11578/m.16522 type:complete len:139 (-) Transcript_11578:292-708(-)
MLRRSNAPHARPRALPRSLQGLRGHFHPRSIIRNDKVDAARGVDNATKFGECLAKTRFRVENHELPRSALSCVNLCQRYLSPYKQARASQQQTSVAVAAVTPPATTSKSTKTAKVAKAASNPADTTASMVAAVQAAVA